MVIELAAAWPRSLKYSGFINRRNKKATDGDSVSEASQWCRNTVS